MRNFVQEGDVVTLTAPYDVSAGGGALIGYIFGVAVGDVDEGDEGEFRRKGVFDLAATTANTFAQGDRVYWNDATKKCTSSSTGHSLIGTAKAAKANGETTVRIILDGVSL